MFCGEVKGVLEVRLTRRALGRVRTDVLHVSEWEPNKKMVLQAGIRSRQGKPFFWVRASQWKDNIYGIPRSRELRTLEGAPADLGKEFPERD